MADDASTPRLDRGSALALIGIAIGVPIVVLGAGSWAGTYYSNVRIAAVVTGAIATTVWLIIALRFPGQRPQSQLSGAFAAALGAFAVSTLFAWNVRLAVDFL